MHPLHSRHLRYNHSAGCLAFGSFYHHYHQHFLYYSAQILQNTIIEFQYKPSHLQSVPRTIHYAARADKESLHKEQRSPQVLVAHGMTSNDDTEYVK